MSKSVKRVEGRRKWLSGLAITLTTIIAYLAFWRLSPVVTFVVGCASLIAMAVAIWIAGGAKSDRSEG